MLTLFNKNKTLMIVIFIITGLSLIVFLAWRLANKEPAGLMAEKYLIEDSTLPKSKWLRKIETERAENIQTITNRYDGYQITVPAEWNVFNEVRGGGENGLLISDPDSQISEKEPLETGSVKFLLVVNTFSNPNNYSITDWLRQSNDALAFRGSEFERITLEDYEIYKTEGGFIVEKIINNRAVEIADTNTLEAHYIVQAPGRSNIYVITCNIFEELEKFSPLCEEQVQTFKILR